MLRGGWRSGRSRRSSRRSLLRCQPSEGTHDLHQGRAMPAQVGERDARCSLPRRGSQLHSTPAPRPMLFAIAAPSMPSGGERPRPKIRIGSSTMFSALATRQHTHRRRCVACAAEDRVDDEQQQAPPRFAAEHPLGVAVARVRWPRRPLPSTAADPAPRRCPPRQRAARRGAATRMACTADNAASSPRCSPTRRATIAVTAIASFMRNRIEQEAVGLGQPDRGHRGRSELGDEEDVDDRPAKVDSSTSSSIIGTASRNTARLRGMRGNRRWCRAAPRAGRPTAWWRPCRRSLAPRSWAPCRVRSCARPPQHVNPPSRPGRRRCERRDAKGFRLPHTVGHDSGP